MTTMQEKVEAVWGGPGMFSRVPEKDYFALDAGSPSRLKIIAKQSCEHLKYEIDHGGERPDTKAKKLGRATHCALFEPDRFKTDYLIAERCTAIKKDGEQCTHFGIGLVDGKWRCGIPAHGGVEDPNIVPGSEAENIPGMVESVKRDAEACQLVRCDGWTEVSMVWQDINTGELCKCRIDRLVRVNNMVVFDGEKPWTGYAVIDAKTCINAGDRGYKKFLRECYDQYYHVQAAMNLDAVIRHCKVNAKQVRFFNLAIEKTAPYATRIYEIMPSMLTLGWDEFQNNLAVYSKCKRTGVWPGYSPHHVKVEKEDWMKVTTEEIADDDDATQSNG